MAEKIDAEAMKNANLMDLTSIVVGDVALRTAQRESAEFKGLCASIEENGVYQPILVRPYDQDHTKVLLVDGLQRFTCMQDLYAKTGDPKYSKIPVNLVTMDAMEMMAAQIQTNLHKIAMKPAAYGKQIRNMMALNTLLTVTSIAKSLGVSAQWVSKCISLHTLRGDIAALVDEGEIAATNAFVLAKLPQDEQEKWVERAMTQEPKEFVDACDARVREIREATKEGKEAKPEEFIPSLRVRPAGMLKAEYATHDVRNALVSANMKPSEAFDLAIAWVLNQDPDTYAADKAKWQAQLDERKAKKAAAEARAAEEKAAKAAAAAAANAEVAAQA